MGMTHGQMGTRGFEPFRGLDMVPFIARGGDTAGHGPAKLVIAIDGPSASGKGTLARRLGARLGYAVLDTGALYRAVAWTVAHRGQRPEDPDAAAQAAQDIARARSYALLADPALRSDAVGSGASVVAAYTPVRAALVAMQRDFAASPPVLPGGRPARGAILDGRDIGTVICPTADVKLFITADPVERAKRRARELQMAGAQVTQEEVFSAMRTRDARDSARTLAPLRPAEDAFVIDTTRMRVGEILERALGIVRGTLVHRACSVA
jgi:CMP/dCMP kinase